MKNILLVFCLLAFATSAMALVPYSLRMRGMGTGLVGIVDDELSNLFFNPGFVNKLQGSRVFTNLSNFHGQGSDMVFDNWYNSPQYNMLGGITAYNDMKIGALLELAGADVVYAHEEYETEIGGNDVLIDTMTAQLKMKGTRSTFGLIWGKKIAGYDFGILASPTWANEHMQTTYDISSYAYRNDTMLSYTYQHIDSSAQAKATYIPVRVGIIAGTPQNEMSACAALNFTSSSDFIPYNTLNSILLQGVSQTPTSHNFAFQNMEEKMNQNGVFISLLGRNKRRYADYSLTYLAGLEFGTQPIKFSAYDSIYSFSVPYPGDTTEVMLDSAIKGSGTNNRFTFGVGIGAEKYFDIAGARHLFAVGFKPGYVTGTYKIKLDPGTISSSYYNKMSNLRYTYYSVSGEYVEQKITYGGFSISIPVGLETYLTPRLSLRLGASEDMIFSFKQNIEETVIDSGWTEQWTYTQPNDTVIYDEEPDNELDSYYTSGETKIKCSNSTTYYYGFGYKINDKVELNFLNTAELTNLRCWILGVNIKW